jgi:imidazolonepropionase-like amidohydrolase
MRVFMLAAAGLAALFLAAPVRAQVTAFEGARVIVGDGSAPLENATVLIDGARIVQVGRTADIRVPAGATRVNLAGKTVMPAIVDTHTHLSQTREALLQDLKRRAYFGIGGVMSLGTDSGALLPMRRETIPNASRYFSAGRGITGPEPGRTNVPYWITTEAEGRRAVGELAAQQVDIVKIWVDDRNGMYQKLPPAVYGAVIDEAHRRGVRVIAHIFTLDDAKGVLRAGIDAFAHGVRDRDIDEEGVALFRQHPNVVVGPNMPDRGVRTDVSWLRGQIPAAEMAEVEKANVDSGDAQRAHGIQARNLARINAAGVRIVLGTDGNTAWEPHVQMEDMVLAGMTPMQVIVAATKNSAEFLRMDSGVLAAGKSADLLVLDANPLDDIKNTRKISAVYLRGAGVDRSRAP